MGVDKTFQVPGFFFQLIRKRIHPPRSKENLPGFENTFRLTSAPSGRTPSPSPMDPSILHIPTCQLLSLGTKAAGVTGVLDAWHMASRRVSQINNIKSPTQIIRGSFKLKFVNSAGRMDAEAGVLVSTSRKQKTQPPWLPWEVPSSWTSEYTTRRGGSDTTAMFSLPLPFLCSKGSWEMMPPRCRQCG